MTRLTNRRTVALTTVVLALLLMAAATQTWLVGTSADTGLGVSSVRATGGEAATGIVGLALVVVAGVIAAAVVGVRVRTVAIGLACLAAAGAAALGTWVVADPAGRLGPLAAAAVGRTGSLEVLAQPTAWAWVGVLAAWALFGVSVLAAIGVRHWPAPSARYDSPVGSSGAPGTRAGARGERVEGAWEQLTAGGDPTDVPEQPPT